MLLPRLGNFLYEPCEVIGIAIAVKLYIGRIAAGCKDETNDLLLLGRQQTVAVMIAVVGAVAAQVSFDLCAQRAVVLAFHLGKWFLESPCPADDLHGLEVGAAAPLGNG